MTSPIEAERTRLTSLAEDAERTLRFVEGVLDPADFQMSLIFAADGPKRPQMSGFVASVSPLAAKRALEALRDAAREEIALLGDGDAPA